ncbi:probable Co/Zn/Cd efflux system membrane fusion protein [Halorhodospira halochloris]|uniref:Probable Co/Zn/Cd efflux system membrane fusion protein n=1 Tax=Halorhodospira halochloris TaxID=1052 RepID=A0A0X8X809_HALHR|nr:hypothetical protein [Halorhodospira halochloris]MBK1650787.1 hypothetical protein [Halorhodospira halochloris]BAU56717.1 probable Co/Zn/Cd efflux system membrane fusion protein [Halorhodospira halochloris]
MSKYTTTASTLVLAMALSGTAWAVTDENNANGNDQGGTPSSVNTQADASGAAASEGSTARADNREMTESHNHSDSYNRSMSDSKNQHDASDNSSSVADSHNDNSDHSKDIAESYNTMHDSHNEYADSFNNFLDIEATVAMSELKGTVTGNTLSLGGESDAVFRVNNSLHEGSVSGNAGITQVSQNGGVGSLIQQNVTMQGNVSINPTN